MNITFEFGEKELKFQLPYIIRKRTRRKWWFDKLEYYIVYEFCKTGPYDLTTADELLLLSLSVYL